MVDGVRIRAGADRDRVLDAVKTLALFVVVLAHAIAWDVSTGEPASILDLNPGLTWVTWTLQIMPLFFAAGAVANLASWRRRPEAVTFWRRRTLRLASPALIYSAFWTVLMLPAAAVVPAAEAAGRYLSFLLWFLGVYAAVVAAVPWTSRWVARPVVPLLAWLTVIALVDLVRWQVWPLLGWANLLLVWGWVHQLGYSLPALRQVPPRRLLGGAALAGSAALALAVLGPYSRSLVSFAGDPEMSNTSPPTLVLALYGLAEVLLLSAAWPWLERALAHDRLWMLVGAAGSRALGIYLWHFPVITLCVGVVLAVGVTAPPLSPVWWLVHVAVLALTLAGAWVLAGLAGRVDVRLRGTLDALPRRAVPVLPLSLLAALSILMICQTGFGTWWGAGLLGTPSASLATLGLLALAVWGLGVADVAVQQPARSAVRADQPHVATVVHVPD